MPRPRKYTSNVQRQRADRARLTADVTDPIETKQRVRAELRRQLDPTRRSERVEEFEYSLHHKVVGQDTAIDAVVDVFQMFAAGMSPQDRPVGNLLFLGPTGTGKTKVVEAVADTLFGDPQALIKIDLSLIHISEPTRPY